MGEGGKEELMRGEGGCDVCLHVKLQAEKLHIQRKAATDGYWIRPRLEIRVGPQRPINTVKKGQNMGPLNSLT